MEDHNKIRFALLIEYDGTNLVGWQKQNNGQSIQEYIEMAAQEIFQCYCTIQSAGRTDAGVHAKGQVAHIDLPKNHDLINKKSYYMISAFNALLKKTRIRVISIQKATFDFHARFSATKRHYKYRFYCRVAPPGLEKYRVWHLRKNLNIKAMEEGVKYLIGKHDFSSFRTSKCQAKSPIRTLDKIIIYNEGIEVIMKITAKSFLHSQVRIIAGSIIKIGDGTWVPEKISDILKAKNRIFAGQTAPACGLYLDKIEYPESLLNKEWPIANT